MKKLFKIVTTFTFGLFLIFILTGCKNTSDDQFEAIKDRGYFIVGFDQTFAPMGYRDTNGEFVGFDIDLAKEVGKELGLEVRLQPIDWAMKEAELKKGNIDVIWNGYTITEERKKLVTFSDPYLENRQVIVVLSSSNILTKADLAGQKVGVQLASSSYDAVMKETSLVNTLDGKKLYSYKTNDLAFNDLDSSGVDAIVVDEILARYIITLKGASKYRVLEDNFGTELYGVGMRKTDIQFIEAFNEAFNTIKDNGKASQISETWFSEDIIK